MSRHPLRHDLIWPDPAWWTVSSGATGAHPPEIAHAIADWSRSGHPLVVRRRIGADAPDHVPVALSTGIGAARLRLALSVPRDQVRRHTRPPALGEIVRAPGLPDRFRALADAVLRIGHVTGIVPRVFGSLMWQHVTGQPHLHDGSDLDLVWTPSEGPRADLALLLRALTGLDAAPPTEDAPRLDGEIAFDGIGGVQWRELASGAAEVLARGETGVRLLRRDLLLAMPIAAGAEPR